MDGETRRSWFVDRREGDWWIVDDGADHVLELPVWLIPHGTRAGDVLEVVADDLEGGLRRIVIRRNEEESEAVRRETETTLQRLRQKDPDGDLTL